MEPCITAGTGIEETGFGYTMSLVSAWGPSPTRR